MNDAPSTRRAIWPWILALPLVAAASAAGMYFYLRGGSPAANIAPVPPSLATAPAAGAEALILLSPEAVTRAGIQTIAAKRGRIARDITVPGTVEPNAYRQVVIVSTAAGQIRTVTADLGARVQRGDLLATIYSPELAEAQRTLVSMRADLDAAHRRVSRLEELVKIGAASQQELEAARAEHVRHATDVESARAKLTLLGLTSTQVESLNDAARIDSTQRVLAPATGVITKRAINPGLNVSASTELFTVVDLTSVWIVANAYERDLGRVRIGTPATITTPTAPGRVWKGQVSYVDPQIVPETRTARVRIDVANADGSLRLGTYADVVLSGTASENALTVPRAALQTVGPQTVLYVADVGQAGRYTERSVNVGSSAGDDAEIRAGLAEGELVVTTGSFALRAERDRLGLPPPVAVLANVPVRNPTRQEIVITKEGFTPSSVSAAVGVPLELIFIRRTDETCATEVVVPAAKARKALPLDQPVVVQVTPTAAATLTFACGMDMLRGSIVVR